MNWLKNKLRAWLDVPRTDTYVNASNGLKALFDCHDGQITELTQRIQDLEDAYPGYKQAKEDADKKPESLIAGFLPHSKRKRAWEAEHRKPEKK